MIKIKRKMANVILFFLIIFPNLLMPCTCYENNKNQKIEISNFDLIITGRIIEKELLSSSNGSWEYNDSIRFDLINENYFKYTLEIQELYSPIFFKNYYVVVFAKQQSSACGLELNFGETYTIFATYEEINISSRLDSPSYLFGGTKNLDLMTNKCTPTQLTSLEFTKKLDSMFDKKIIYHKKIIKLN